MKDVYIKPGHCKNHCLTENRLNKHNIMFERPPVVILLQYVCNNLKDILIFKRTLKQTKPPTMFYLSDRYAI